MKTNNKKEPSPYFLRIFSFCFSLDIKLSSIQRECTDCRLCGDGKITKELYFLDGKSNCPATIKIKSAIAPLHISSYDMSTVIEFVSLSKISADNTLFVFS